MAPKSSGTIAWRELVDEATARLTTSTVQNPAQEARWLVEEASGHSGNDYLTGLDDLCTVRGVARFDAMIARREAGEPIQYVLGHWPFRELDLLVDRRVLIPRPETEVVVGVALDELARQRSGAAMRAADLGTGSGAIALSVAVEATDVHVVGVERSADALAVTRANLAGIGNPARRVELLEGSWFEPLAGSAPFNVVVANPPYVATTFDLPRSVGDWEPTEALLSGPSGLDDANVILEEVRRWLVPDGAVVLELGSEHMDEAVSMATSAGLVDVQVFDDLAGQPRVLRGRNWCQ